MPSTQNLLDTVPKQELPRRHSSVSPEQATRATQELSSSDTDASPLNLELRTDAITTIPDSSIAAPNVPRQAADPGAVRAAKDPLTLDIEKILEENIAESFLSMTPEQQHTFKIVGERVTSTIRQIIKSGVIQIKKILTLIRDWLSSIPGVNRFFLEKESKIKAEKILLLGKQF
jgi:hypothetical protein